MEETNNITDMKLLEITLITAVIIVYTGLCIFCGAIIDRVIVNKKLDLLIVELKSNR